MKELKVLIIEDSEDDALLLRRHLERAGYSVQAIRVDTAVGLKKALAEGVWDLALSDNRMPSFNALAALEILKRSDASVPFIIISGTISEETAVEAMRAGATDYLMKGDLTRFVPAVERALQEAENLRARRCAEEELRASEAELQVIFKAMSDVIVVLDAEGRIQKIIPTSRDLLYTPTRGAPRKTVHEIFPKEKADFFLEYIGRALRECRTQRVEYSLEVRGTEVWFDASVSPISKAEAVWVARDITEHKTAADALRASEAKYRQIIETGNEGIWMIDMEGKTLFANQRVAEMLGTTVEEMVGRSVFQFVFEEDLAEAKRRLEERRRGAFGQTEFRVRRQDGTSIHTLSNTSPLKNEAGEVIGVLAMLSDITERKRAEEELRESEERFRSIFEGGPMGMAVVGLDAKFIQVNEAFCEVLGYTEREFLSRTFPEITHPEDVNANIHQAERLFRGEIDKYHLEKRFITKNGETVWANLTATLIRDREGRPMYGIGMIEDITERKRAEARLQEVVRSKEESLALLDTIISSAPIGFAFHNCDLAIERINESLATIVGLTVEEHLGHTLHEIAPEVAEAIEPYLRQVLETGEPILDIELSGKPFAVHGRQHYWLASFYPVRMQGGELLGIGALVSDITERKRVEERLKSSNEELRALSARLQLVREEESIRIAREIHDELGGALTGLKMDLSWLDKRLSEPAKAAKQQKMRSMLELMDETIQKVRNIATELRPAILDDLGLAAAIEWQAREFQNRTEIECRIISLHEDFTISSEKATAVFRIFQELLTNIARHAGATLVEIRMEKQNGDVILEVSDNGRGIKESEVSNTKSLGLLGMRERALVFGGRVHIARAEGKGTEVTVRIPHD